MKTGERVLRLAPTLVLGLVVSGCVIRYGEKQAPAAEQAEALPVRPVDFGPVERQLALLIDQSTDVDARDRLEHAWSLAQSMEGADPASQHIVRAYLDEMLAIEARASPEGTSSQTRTLGGGFAGSISVDSEELAGPEPMRTVERRPAVSVLDPMALEGEADGEGEVVESPPETGPNVDLLLADAVRHLEARKPDKAMEVLETCRDLPCWSEVSDAWGKARDTLVFTRKEGLAVRFLELRQETDTVARRAALLTIQEELSTLRASWPGSSHSDDIEQHMARVQKELELMSGDE